MSLLGAVTAENIEAGYVAPVVAKEHMFCHQSRASTGMKTQTLMNDTRRRSHMKLRYQVKSHLEIQHLPILTSQPPEPTCSDCEDSTDSSFESTAVDNSVNNDFEDSNLTAREKAGLSHSVASATAAIATLCLFVAMLATFVIRQRVGRTANSQSDDPNWATENDRLGNASTSLGGLLGDIARPEIAAESLHAIVEVSPTGITHLGPGCAELEREREEMRAVWNEREKQRAQNAAFGVRSGGGTGSIAKRFSMGRGADRTLHLEKVSFWQRRRKGDRMTFVGHSSPLSQSLIPDIPIPAPVIARFSARCSSDSVDQSRASLDLCADCITPSLNTHSTARIAPISSQQSLELEPKAKAPSTISTSTASTSSHVYRVLSPHVPEMSDEIPLKAGDSVVISHVWEDGWCRGSRVDEEGELLGVTGVFPMFCLRKQVDGVRTGDIDLVTLQHQHSSRSSQCDRVSIMSELTIDKSLDRTCSTREFLVGEDGEREWVKVRGARE